MNATIDLPLCWLVLLKAKVSQNANVVMNGRIVTVVIVIHSLLSWLRLFSSHRLCVTDADFYVKIQTSQKLEI